MDDGMHLQIYIIDILTWVTNAGTVIVEALL